ncbi:YheC/YheD family protein [Candidatus Clostridium radicumherbarum]|uniref:YheC/YheD family protein n=1 Tax=Candidatus Clostridium radicumherbarum TaxID=3381662 RepID=A0ABW8TWT1_9CLOT
MDNYVKISYLESLDNYSCFLTNEQLKFFTLEDLSSPLFLTIGSSKLKLNKIISDNNNFNPNKLCFSKDLKRIIGIREGTSIQFRKLDKNHLEIGPLIGVFISTKKVANLINGSTDSVYEQLFSVSKNLNGMCCFFSIGDIDWNSKQIKALIFEDLKWKSCIIPLPKVIYDRCFGDYAHKHSTELRQRLGNGYSIINRIPKLGKWETITALNKNSALIESIPETVLFKQNDDIKRMLNKFHSVYFKPDLLYKGKGVFRISPGEGSSYIVEYRDADNNVNVVKCLDNLDNLKDLIMDYSIKGGGYIIQKEIHKAAYKNVPFDFRLLYQKNWKGTWEPTGISVRMGAEGSVITSPRSGGSVEQFSTILKEVFNEDISTKGGLYERVIKIGREVAQTIDREFGDCVELGLDMTIDMDSKIWIIEVNGKPLKVSLKWLNDPQIINRAYNRPVEYAIYLTGFKSADTVAQVN